MRSQHMSPDSLELGLQEVAHRCCRFAEFGNSVMHRHGEYSRRTHKCRHVVATNFNGRFVGLWCWWLVKWLVRLTCLAAFALTLLVCLFACRRERNDRTRRGPMQRGATLPLPSGWASTKGFSNTCGQPHCATSMWLKQPFYWALAMATTNFRIAIDIWKVRARPIHLAPNLHKGHHSPKHNTLCCCRCCCCCCS